MATSPKRLGAAVGDFLETSERKRSQGTTRAYRNTLGSLQAFLGDPAMRDLTTSHLESFFYGPKGIRAVHVTGTGIVKEPVGDQTFNNYRAKIATFFKYCMRKGWVKIDLMEEVALMHVATDVPRLRLPLTSLLGMLDLTTNPRDRVYLATAMSTLKRSSELVPLTIDKVDLQGGWLQVYNQKSKIWDSLGIGTELDGELRRWMVDYADAIGRPLNGGDLLFPGAKNRAIIGWEGEPGHKTRVFEPLVWEPDKVMRHSEEIVKRVLQEMGVEDIKGTGTHTVRRSMARVVFDHLSSQDGYTNALRTVSRMLNHRQAATTEIYLGIDEERTRRDELMRGVPFLTNMLPDRSNVVSLHAAK